MARGYPIHRTGSPRFRDNAGVRLVSKVSLDKEFVAQHLTADQCRPRKVLYEDPELGFCICGHVYETPAHGTPHDHGSSWAIYGLAVGDTEMTDWHVVQLGDEVNPTLDRIYFLQPGRRAFLRCRCGSLAKTGGRDQVGAHRRRQPRSHQTLEHQGGLTAATYSLAVGRPHSH
jgi:hypothetical protein